MLQETFFCLQSRTPRTIAAPIGTAGLQTQFSFTLQTVAGASILSADGQHGIWWQVANGSAGSLVLAQFSATAGATQQPVSLEFGTQLFPSIVFLPHPHATGTHVLVTGVTAAGQLFTLPVCLDSTESGISSITADSLRMVDISAHWASLGSPTCLACCPGHLLLGGAQGSVLCVPSAWLLDPRPQRTPASDPHSPLSTPPFELHENSWGIRSLIAGVWQRSSHPAVIALLPLPLSPTPPATNGSSSGQGAASLLLAVYSDSSTRLFHTGRRAHLASDSLDPGGSKRSPMTASLHPSTLAPPAADPAASQAVSLVVHWEAPDTLTKSVSVFSLTWSGQNPNRLSNRRRWELDVSPTTALVACHAPPAAGQLWAVLRAPGAAVQLACFDCSSAGVGQQVGQGCLMEEGLLPLASAGGGGAGDAMHQVLWEASLTLTPPSLHLPGPTTSTATLPTSASHTPDTGPTASTTTSTAAMAASAAQQQVLRRMLSPSSLCRASLRDALTYHGAQMSAAEVEAAPLTQLEAALVAVVQALAARVQRQGQSTAGCWAQLLASYQAAWARRHPLLALLPHPQHPAWLASVRGGGLLGLLRPLTPPEALVAACQAAATHPAPAALSSSSPHPTLPGPGSGVTAGALGTQQQGSGQASPFGLLVNGVGAGMGGVLPDTVAVVARAAGEVGGLAGPLLLDAFSSQVLRGQGAQEQLLPSLAKLLLRGPGARGHRERGGQGLYQGVALGLGGGRGGAYTQPGAGGGAGAGDGHRGQYTSLLEQASRQGLQLPAPPLAITSTHPPLNPANRAATNFLLASTCQAASAQLRLARDALLLLSLLDLEPALGAQVLSASSHAQLQGRVTARLKQLALGAALAAWLCSTPAAAAEAGDAYDPALQALAQLQLSSRALTLQPHPTLAPHPLPQQPTPRLLLTPLAAKLLPSLMPQLSAPDALLQGSSQAAALLLAQLQQGGSQTQQPGPGAGQGPRGAESLRKGFMARVCDLGLTLFESREYAALATLAGLASSSSSSSCAGGRGSGGEAAAGGGGVEAAPCQLLSALSLVGQVAGLQGGARQRAVGQAASNFFSAAAGLVPGGVLHVMLCRLLRHLGSQDLQAALPHLQLAVEEGGQQGGQQQQAVSALQQQLYESAMMLFEREGVPEGALIFARAALQHSTHFSHTSAATASTAPTATTAASQPRRSSGSSRAAGQAIRNKNAAAAAAAEAGLLAAVAAKDALDQQDHLDWQGWLWTNVFTYCCQLERWEDAYAALVSNPLPQRALDCLRQLIRRLTGAGQLLTLCALPLAGTLLLPEHPQPSPAAAGPPAAPLLPRGRDAGAGAAAAWVRGAASRAAGAGVALGNGGGGGGDGSSLRLVSLLEEAVAALQQQASTADVSSQPQPYLVLADFCTARCDYRGAAQAQLAYARRLRAEGSAAHQQLATEVLAAYESALNCLALVDEAEAWLDLQHPWMRLHPLPAPPPPQAASPAPGSSGLPPLPVLTLAELHAEYALVRAAVVVAEEGGVQGLDLSVALSPDTLLSQLLLCSAYDPALALAHATWPPASTALALALGRVAASLATAAAQSQLQQSQDLPSSLDPAAFAPAAKSGQPQHTSSSNTGRSQQERGGQGGRPSGQGSQGVAGTGGSSRGGAGLAGDVVEQQRLRGQGCWGSAAAPLWGKLQALLLRYCNAQAGGSSGVGAGGVRDLMRVAAADAVWRVDRRLGLPLWLLQLFMEDVDGNGQGLPPTASGMAVSGCGPAALLELQLTHDRLQDAVLLVAQCMASWSRTDTRARKQLAATWFPHNTIQALRAQLVLEVEQGRSAAGGLLQRLDGVLQEHLRLAAQDSTSAYAPIADAQAAGPSALTMMAWT
ncbi:hypothetical protein V8C86DRAFT_3132999 [Haematococcus lacustris]